MLHLEKFQLLVIIQQARLPQVTLMLYQFVAIVQIAFKHFDSILSMYLLRIKKHDQISSSFMTKIMIAYLLMPNRIVTRSSF